MKFDVYRPAGDSNRYVGMVKVIRLMDEGSMVVSSYTEVNSLVCPKTGRVVFEPDAVYSPFATDDNGQPLKLVCSNTIKMPLEAPNIGDLLDNPFYDPERAMQFAVAIDAADPCLLLSIEALGGVANTGQNTIAPDFIVTNGEPADGLDAPAVTPQHVYRYIELPQQ